MRRIVLVFLLIVFAASPAYAEGRLGLGIDFKKSDEKYESTNDYRVDVEDNEFGLRLYYEYLLKELLGIQLELGFSKYESSDKTNDNTVPVYIPDSQDYGFDDYLKIELSVLFKYYFHMKNNISLYIAGGLGLEYKDYQTKDVYYDYDSVYQNRIDIRTFDLIDQAGIGIQFHLSKRFSIFIEDRFKNKISNGQLRVGFYVLPRDIKVNRR